MNDLMNVGGVLGVALIILIAIDIASVQQDIGWMSFQHGPQRLSDWKPALAEPKLVALLEAAHHVVKYFAAQCCIPDAGFEIESALAAYDEAVKQ